MKVRWLAVNRHRVQWVEVRCEKAHLLHPLVLQLIVLLHLHLPGATAPQVEGRGRRQWYCRRGVVAVLVLQLSVVSHLPGATAPEVAAMILDLVLAEDVGLDAVGVERGPAIVGAVVTEGA